MKQFIITLAIVTALCQINTPFANAQTKKDAVSYKIQVAAYKNLAFAKVDTLFSIGNVYAEDAGNGISRVVVGYYADAATADKILTKVKQAGFPDAFVSTQKGKVDTAVSKLMTRQTEAPAQPMQTLNTANQSYLVVLGKFATLAEVKLGLVSELGDMYVEDDQGKIKIIIGPFADKAKADAALASARGKGFSEATLQAVAVQNPTQGTPVQKQDEASTPMSTFNANDTGAVNAQTPAEAVYRPGAPISPPASNVPPPSQLIDFGQFTTYFAATQFDIFNVDPYDPIQEKNNNLSATDPALAAKNKQLSGNQLPTRLLYLFTNSPNQTLSYYALYRFQISSDFDGYIVRSGIGKYDQDNFITLYVYDKTKMQFVAQEVLSSAKGSPGFFSATESWIMDLNADTIPDLLSYTTEEYNSLTQGYKASNKFTAKLWLDNKFVDAQIVNEDKLRQQLGLE